MPLELSNCQTSELRMSHRLKLSNCQSLEPGGQPRNLKPSLQTPNFQTFQCSNFRPFSFRNCRTFKLEAPEPVKPSNFQTFKVSDSRTLRAFRTRQRLKFRPRAGPCKAHVVRASVVHACSGASKAHTELGFQHSHSDKPKRGCLVQGESTLAMHAFRTRVGSSTASD